MNKYLKGILLGGLAGVFDVIPMILQGLSRDANLSAFSMWIIIGFIISAVDLKMKGIFKGMLISILVLFPSAILIGWKEPQTLLVVIPITLILGSGLGFFIQKSK